MDKTFKPQAPEPMYLDDVCVVVRWHGIMPPEEDTWMLKATALGVVTRYLPPLDATALQSLVLSGNKVRIDIGPPVGLDKPVPVRMSIIEGRIGVLP